MKRAYTLIEILIAVSIMAFISGGVLINLNQYNLRQTLDKSVEDVTSILKLTQNYAKIRQLPIGTVETELKYIRLYMENGMYLVAEANGVGETYFYTKVGRSDIGVSSTPGDVYFWPGSGRLSKDALGTPYLSNEKVVFTIRMDGATVKYGKLEVNPLGQVNNLGIFNE